MAIDIGGNWVRGVDASDTYQDCRIDNLITKRPIGMMTRSSGLVNIPTVYPFNVSSLSYNNSGNSTTDLRYNCLEKGIYFVMVRLMTENDSYHSNYYAFIRRNGNRFPALCYTSNLGNYHMEMQVACVIDMWEGDYIDVYVQYGGPFYGSNQRYTRLVVFRMA